jgi:hypothetical protein
MLTSLPEKFLIATIPHELGDVKIYDNGKIKIAQSTWYNYFFDKITGQHVRWGNKLEDNPAFAPGPEILDIEISINGCPNGKELCPWCYKGNTNEPAFNMTLDTFKKIMSKMPKTLTQIAIGITGVQTNPDLIPMMEHCREIGIVPNFTLSGIDLTDEIAGKVSKLSGAIAVSAYSKKDVCYDTVALLTQKYGMKQINVHKLVAAETYDECMDLLHDAQSDPRLSKLNAMVFLLLKPKNRGANFHKISFYKYKAMIDYALEHKLRVGFDSCSANSFLRCIKDHKDYNKIDMLVEPCESFGMFSSYISAEGIYYPCSFSEGEGDWKEGFNVLECDDFIKDIWTSEKLIKWRNRIIEESADHLCRVCPIFDVELT